MPCKNIVQFSSAGSGKTTEIVDEVLEDKQSKILILTYTKENCYTIEKKLKEENGFVPNNVKLISWANFIMCDCVRPFHSNKCISNIKNFIFDIPKDKKGIAINLNYRNDDLRRYISPKNWIYYDYATDFAIQCNLNNCVIERLQKNYDKIYIDEVQDLAGYDLDLLELLLKSTITIKMFGDIRQATYRTQNVNKNSAYRGIKIKLKFNEWADILQ
ncbi:MAG: UvrD-helicase domain-containing protein [Clostridia bacterium]|jgi:DNA helicase-2/ATP-dependent DNA helicase PcrA|nr:UvrD-helicase domain-containing protein [Clostridia bacterium]